MFDFDGYEEQYHPFRCTSCYIDLTFENIIGIGLYPSNGVRSYNGNEAFGFECPKCFTKSCCHTSDVMKRAYQRYLETGDNLFKDK